MYGAQTRKVIGYFMMPAIVPRVRELFISGFGYIAFLMASIYAMVRLLPLSHPYLNPANIGKFGIRHVIAEAANNLVIKKENIDQLIVFVALLAGAVLLLLQFILLLWSVFMQHANAANLFGTLAPNGDIAFMLLDHVFGVPGLFNSCIATAAVCPGAAAASPPFPYPFHTALRELFEFYSIGLLFIGVLIFLYFVIVVIVETTTTGTPFGQRFATIWAPIRLVVALALLVPVNWGLNAAQYLTLYAAKLGSGFATNSWIIYNNAIAADPDDPSNNPLGESYSLIALPKPPEISIMAGIMSIINTCAYAYWKTDSTMVADPQGHLHPRAKVRPYMIKIPLPGGDGRDVQEITRARMGNYGDALTFYDNSDIIIRFGEYSPQKYPNEKGNVAPLCGDIRIKVDTVFDASARGWPWAQANGGPEYILGTYFLTMMDFWFDAFDLHQFSLRMAELYLKPQDATTPVRYWQCGDGVGQPNPGCAVPTLPACAGGPPRPCEKEKPGSQWKQEIIDRYQAGAMDAAVIFAWDNYNRTGANLAIDNAVLNRGWAGAGIWFNKLAQFNGSFVAAVMNVPTMEKYPEVMEQVREVKMGKDASFNGYNQFEPSVAGDGEAENQMKIAGDIQIAQALNAVYQYWHRDGLDQLDQEKELSTNIILDTMNILFGTRGLFDIRQENAHTHPLAALVAVGKGLVESAIRNIGYGTGFAFMGGAMGALSQGSSTGQAMDAISGLLVSVSFLGLTAGIVLFYVVPFLPFIYFYFAVANWLKTIFEAMVGVPLWALAHLRLDGNGLPGESAANGYFLLFEIFIRPILTVFGLIAALTIFSAQVRVLNFIWDLVTSNLTGFNQNPTLAVALNFEIKRDIVDQFFFTIIYTIIVYMLAMASFKLIDRIPQGILRWMGSGVSAYGDINQEPVENVGRTVGTGGLVFGQQVAGGLTSTARQAGSALGPAGGRLGQMTRGG